MLTKEWKLEDALAVRYEEGWEDGQEKGREKGREEGWKGGERNIVEMLKSGRSPEEIIRDFETKTVTASPTGARG